MHNLTRQAKMNKKIASEIAVGIILLIAIVIGGFFWIQNKKQEIAYNANIVKSSAQELENQSIDNQTGNDSQILTENFQKDPCKGHLYEGETSLRGQYILDLNPISNQKEWMFKVAKDDIAELPVQIKLENGKDVNELLKIEDATPEVISKLKKASENNPETIIIKGYYLQCNNIPVVSIESPKIALAKYIKK